MSADTPLLRRAVPALRVELADAATRGRALTLAEASALLGLTSPQHGSPAHTSAVLDALGRACAERGEPDLASLVLRDDDQPLAAGACEAERRRCWNHWGGPTAELTGAELTGAALTGAALTAR